MLTVNFLLMLFVFYSLLMIWLNLIKTGKFTEDEK